MRWTAAPLVASLVTSLPALAVAQPVLAVRVGDAYAPTGLVDRIVVGVGATARHGPELTAALTERFGRVAPAGDPLRARREAVAPLVQNYFTGRAGRTAARRGLTALVEEMARVPEALALVEGDRAQYLRALMLLAHDAREEESPARAEPWLRRVIDFDRAWQAPVAEWSPALRAQLDQLRGGAPTGEGTLTVRVAREGCGATVDGRPLAGAVPAGSHRVAVTCSARPRIRVVTVPAGGTVALTIDPALDDALDLAATPTLHYATEAERVQRLASDAAAVGAALDEPRVVTVDLGIARVVDAFGGRVLLELDADAPSFEARVGAAARGEAWDPPPPRAVAVHRGPGAGPWVLVGAGAAVAVAGGVLLGMSLGALGDVDAACPAHNCSMLAGAQRASAQSSYEDARTFNTAGWVALGVGAAAAVGGVVWYALASRHSEAPTVSAAVSGEGAAVGVAGRF